MENLTDKQNKILEKAGIIHIDAINLELFVGRKISFVFQEKKRCLLILDIVLDERNRSLIISFYSCHTDDINYPYAINGLIIDTDGKCSVVKTTLDISDNVLRPNEEYDVSDIKIL